ncbi:hypothetical protein ACFLSE_00510 [Bacteroidota bacterium]
MKRLGLIISIISICFIGCEKTADYTEIPFIKYKNFVFDVEVIDDSYINQVGFLTFEFIDGNGDIGFSENSDTILGLEIPDIFIYEYSKQNGNFVAIDTINFLLPYFAEGVYRKHIKGDMQVKIYFIEQVNDTVKYEFQIMDREYHLSNLETTPELIVPEWN